VIAKKKEKFVEGGECKTMEKNTSSKKLQTMKKKRKKKNTLS